MKTSFKEFKTNMDWAVHEFNESELKKIYDSVYTFESSLKEFEDDNEFSDIICDVNLHSVLEYLEDVDRNIVIDNLESPYGRFFIAYLMNEGLYALVIEN